ncbi:MAG: hypothetical protein DWQ08_12900 [Proteobacteria bacterium]|nr:MAG: hypothetical protein DWQ08_12900 [Pseudomonadota bacterium]
MASVGSHPVHKTPLSRQNDGFSPKRRSAMKLFDSTRPLRRFAATLLAGAFCLVSFAGAAKFTGGRPVDPQPDAGTLKAGLAVTYFFRYFDHIDELDGLSGGEAGEPIEQLDHVAFEDGKVLTTDRPMGVGAHIRGFIHLESVGEYTFKLQSNDGVKLSVGGIQMHADPEIHAARWSPDMTYEVSSPGWYDFTLDYYQRKGTSALRLKWVRPDGEEEIVPPVSFAHP